LGVTRKKREDLDLATTRRLFAGALLTVGLALGCGGDTTAKLTQKQVEDRIMGGATADDKAKINEYLAKAKIEGEVTSIEDKGDFWYVDVNLAAKKGGGRGGPMPPKPFKVIKSDGKVTPRTS